MGGNVSSENNESSKDIDESSNATIQMTKSGSSGSRSSDENSEWNPDVHRDMNASKMRGGCRKLAADSYRCLEKGDRDACKPFFEAYKECRKDEHARVLAENGKRFG